MTEDELTAMRIVSIAAVKQQLREDIQKNETMDSVIDRLYRDAESADNSCSKYRHHENYSSAEYYNGYATGIRVAVRELRRFLKEPKR